MFKQSVLNGWERTEVGYAKSLAHQPPTHASLQPCRLWDGEDKVCCKQRIARCISLEKNCYCDNHFSFLRFEWHFTMGCIEIWVMVFPCKLKRGFLCCSKGILHDWKWDQQWKHSSWKLDKRNRCRTNHPRTPACSLVAFGTEKTRCVANKELHVVFRLKRIAIATTIFHF